MAQHSCSKWAPWRIQRWTICRASIQASWAYCLVIIISFRGIASRIQKVSQAHLRGRSFNGCVIRFYAGRIGRACRDDASVYPCRGSTGNCPKHTRKVRNLAGRRDRLRTQPVPCPPRSGSLFGMRGSLIETLHQPLPGNRQPKHWSGSPCRRQPSIQIASRRSCPSFSHRRCGC